MARKNISVGVNTWNELASLGKFGMTFDDIIKILIRQSEELQQFREEQAGETPSYRQQFNTPILFLPGIKFPTSKDEIIRCASGVNTKGEIEELKRLPNKQYNNKKEIEDALLEVLKYNGFIMFDQIHKGLFRVVVDDRVLDEQQKQRRQREIEEFEKQEMNIGL